MLTTSKYGGGAFTKTLVCYELKVKIKNKNYKEIFYLI